MSGAAPALEVRGLHVRYGQVEALHGVDLRVGPGQIVSVVGPNGAGKSTLLLAVIGLLEAEGTVLAGGEPLAGLEVEERVERGLCLVPERRELFAELTVEDNLRLGAYHRRRGLDGAAIERELEAAYARFPRLSDRRRQAAGTLSGGERQMLALGRALMAQPRLLLLDEPSLGLAPLVVREIFHIIAGLKAEGVSILLIEQNARAALAASDYAYVLETGRIVFEGGSAALLEDERIRASYLGVRKGP